jgi:hypothetical protein
LNKSYKLDCVKVANDAKARHGNQFFVHLFDRWLNEIWRRGAEYYSAIGGKRIKPQTIGEKPPIAATDLHQASDH